MKSELTLGIDLDGCITEAPEFFATWTHSWPGRVVVVTFRKDRTEAIRDIEACNVRYDEVVLVDQTDAKAAVLLDQRVDLYVDDQPEMLKNVPSSVFVMLFRNEGNFDFEDQRWVLSKVTGKLI